MIDVFWHIPSILPRAPSAYIYQFDMAPLVRKDAEVTLQVNITPSGRMSLPADIRKRLGLTGGGAVFIEETEDGIVLRTAAQAVARAQAIARQFTGSNPDASVDAFIASRRVDSGE